MATEDYEETNASLARVNRVCKVIAVLLKCVFAVFCVCLLVVFVFLLISSLDQDANATIGEASIFTLFLLLLFGLVMGSLLKVLIDIFSDAAKGESPFTLKQVTRLRLIALLLVAYAAVEATLSLGSAILHVNGLDVGYMATDSGANAIVPLDFAPVIAAAAVFAFSYVFKYGVLLQELSDETL
ncbi:hypothetical protein [Eggerthella sinensis]|uniref:hypothetical protein n=1 Tax=Eggerthella sinensis TaxID=242230 RepID=UPI00266C3E5C|nr:hypothetical protein [Eggerthella sinensis]